MDPNPFISFDNTENAFAYKTDGELKRARFLFKSMSYSWLVKIGTRITPWAIRAGSTHQRAYSENDLQTIRGR